MPCVEELPELKQAYDDYHKHGVEFIGISLDESEANGGREALLKFLDEREIPWPQYYQGNGFDSEFSKSWGVGGIPAMFVIDKEGRLYTSKARGELIEILDVLLTS